MIRLVALGVTMLFSAILFASTATAGQPRPPRCDAHYFGLGNGEGVSVLCESGPSDRFRVIAHCEGGLSSWTDFGTIGYTGFESSEAQCRGLVGPVHVGGYHIDWL